MMPVEGMLVGRTCTIGNTVTPHITGVTQILPPPPLQKTPYGPRPGNVLGPSAKISSFFPSGNGPLDPSIPALRGLRGGSYGPETQCIKQLDKSTFSLLCLRRHRAEALSDDARLTSNDVCMSRTSGLSREQRGLERLKLAQR